MGIGPLVEEIDAKLRLSDARVEWLLPRADRAAGVTNRQVAKAFVRMATGGDIGRPVVTDERTR